MGFFGDLMGFKPPKVNTVDTSQYSKLGNEFFDPNSTRSRGMYNSLKQMGVDAIAQQYLGGQRMQAMGQNPFAQDQYKSGLANNIGQTQNAFNSYMNNSYGVGSGLLGYSLQGDMQNAQARNNANLMASQNKNNFFSGLFGAAASAMPFAMFGMPNSGNNATGGGTAWAGGNGNEQWPKVV